jgi:hypothetical protein
MNLIPVAGQKIGRATAETRLRQSETGIHRGVVGDIRPTLFFYRWDTAENRGREISIFEHQQMRKCRNATKVFLSYSRLI